MSMHEWPDGATPVARAPKLRSRRCQRCRRRKIKCDENWPTCSQCEKAQSPCSGPPGHLDSDSPSPVAQHQPVVADNLEVLDTESQGSGRLLYHLEYPSGSSYTCLHLHSPRVYPTTTTSRVASRLIAYLERGPHIDASSVADYFRLLPARLECSVALRDAVALFCICWGNTCRAYSPKTLVELEAYGKALRSLQRAISGEDNEGKQLACETLAAVSVMDRIEILFGERPRPRSNTHSKGIHSIMDARGPPDLDDDLDVCLAFGNQTVVTNYIISQGANDFYLSADWKDILTKASQQRTVTSQALIEQYLFSLEIGGWPRLVKWVKNVTEDEIDAMKRRSEAPVLWECLDHYKSGLNKILEHMFADVRGGDQMADRPVKDSSGSKVASMDKTIVQRLLMCTTLSLVINRMMRPIARDIGLEALSEIDAEHRQLSEFIWHYLMEMPNMNPILSVLLASPLTLSIDAVAEEAEHALAVFKKLIRQTVQPESKQRKKKEES